MAATGRFNELPNVRGFVPYNVGADGPAILPQLFPCTASSNALGIAIGDTVSLADGNAATHSAGSITSGVLGVVARIYDSKGNDLTGCYWDTTNTTNGRLLKAAKAGYVAIYNPFVQKDYMAVEDADTDYIADADIGLNIGILAAAGDSDGYSTFKLDSNTENTTATLPFKLLQVHPDDSTTAGSGVTRLFIVRLNASTQGLYGATGL